MELWENPRFSFPFLKFGTKLIFNYKSFKSVLAVTHCAMFISGIILYTENECGVDNGGCEHFCIGTFLSYNCSCEDGYILSADGHNCSGISPTSTMHSSQLLCNLCYELIHLSKSLATSCKATY